MRRNNFMEIKIDTNKDSKHDIGNIIKFLQEHLRVQSNDFGGLNDSDLLRSGATVSDEDNSGYFSGGSLEKDKVSEVAESRSDNLFGLFQEKEVQESKKQESSMDLFDTFNINKTIPGQSQDFKKSSFDSEVDEDEKKINLQPY